MKIGITCYPTYGGSGVVATELGKELANRGHDVHFISYALPIRLTMKDRVYFHEVEVLTYPLFEYPPYDLVLATKMAEVMTRFDLDDEGILTHISNFRPVKRVEDVVGIFALVRKRRRARLLMVGDGPDRPKAEWLANTHGVAQDVLFLGKRNDMSELLAISDVLFLPTELNCFGSLPLRAWDARVLSFPHGVGGVREWVGTGS